MIRMFKRWGILIVIVVFLLIFAILGMLSMVSINKYKDAVNVRDTQIINLENALDNIGPLVTGYVVKKDVRSGELIEEEFVEAVDIPQKISDNIATSLSQIVGNYYRVSLDEGTVLTKDDIVEDEIDNSTRKYDLVIDEWPIGLEVGDIVDVRISFTFGEDFIAMSNKQILEINTGVPKIFVTEEDISTYNSMLFDKALYAGAKIYAVEYKDAGSQSKAEIFYPTNQNIAELSAMNPNILEDIRDKMLLERQKLDTLVGGTLGEKDDRELARLDENIKRMRTQFTGTISNAQKEFQKRVEKAAKEAERANK